MHKSDKNQDSIEACLFFMSNNVWNVQKAKRRLMKMEPLMEKIPTKCQCHRCLHSSDSPTELQVPRLNTPALFSFGGEAHLEMFPLFINNSAKNLGCFFIVVRRICMDKSEVDRVIVFLQMIFDRNWPLAVNQITKPKPNIKVCFVMSAKLPIRTKQRGQLHFLKMLKANLLRDGASQKY